MKFCVDCKHFMPHPSDSQRAHLGLCMRAVKKDPPSDYMVTGTGVVREFEFCATMRIRLVDSGGCGTDAVLFELKS